MNNSVVVAAGIVVCPQCGENMYIVKRSLLLTLIVQECKCPDNNCLYSHISYRSTVNRKDI